MRLAREVSERLVMIGGSGRPTSSWSFWTVMIDAPDMRLVARRLLPSVSIVRSCARRSMLSRFILNIMRERSDGILERLGIVKETSGQKPIESGVARRGYEPLSPGLKVRCSALSYRAELEGKRGTSPPPSGYCKWVGPGASAVRPLGSGASYLLMSITSIAVNCITGGAGITQLLVSSWFRSPVHPARCLSA